MKSFKKLPERTVVQSRFEESTFYSRVILDRELVKRSKSRVVERETEEVKSVRHNESPRRHERKWRNTHNEGETGFEKRDGSQKCTGWMSVYSGGKRKSLKQWERIPFRKGDTRISRERRGCLSWRMVHTTGGKWTSTSQWVISVSGNTVLSTWVKVQRSLNPIPCPDTCHPSWPRLPVDGFEGEAFSSVCSDLSEPLSKTRVLLSSEFLCTILSVRPRPGYDNS